MINLLYHGHEIIVLHSLVFVLILGKVSGDCKYGNGTKQGNNSEALKYKLSAIAEVLAAGGLGVSLPLLGKKSAALKPENDMFFMIKAFAAGVILATGFIHILPDAFRSLTSPCLDENPWGKFPFTRFVGMMASIGTVGMSIPWFQQEH